MIRNTNKFQMKLPEAFFAVLFIILLAISKCSYGQAGMIDSTFSDDGRATVFSDGGATSVAIQPDGKILIGGTSTSANFALARFNSNGILDSTFSADGKVQTQFGTVSIGTSMALQDDGKILLGGECETSIGGRDFGLARYNSDGTLDRSFNSNGYVITSFSTSDGHDGGSAIAIQSDGKIIQAGDRSVTGFAAVRFNSNGTLDNSFGTNGKIIFPIGDLRSSCTSICLYPDCKILLGGYSESTTKWKSSFAIMRLNTNGTLDNTFGVGGKDTIFMSTGGNTNQNYEYNIGNTMLIQTDGKILLSGSSALGSNGFGTIPIIRLNTNGSLDNSFGNGGEVQYAVPGLEQIYITKMTLQQDEKIVVVGFIGSLDSVSISFLLARFNMDGSIDSTFGNSGIVKKDISGADDELTAVAMQSDGKIVACGVSAYGMEVVRYLSGLDVGVLDSSVKNNPVLIYPNPVHSQATLHYTLTKDEQISIELFDVHGKLVQQFITNETRTTCNHEEVLELNELLPSGTYIINITIGKNSQGVKVVKE